MPPSRRSERFPPAWERGPPGEAPRPSWEVVNHSTVGIRSYAPLASSVVWSCTDRIDPSARAGSHRRAASGRRRARPWVWPRPRRWPVEISKLELASQTVVSWNQMANGWDGLRRFDMSPEPPIHSSQEWGCQARFHLLPIGNWNPDGATVSRPRRHDAFVLTISAECTVRRSLNVHPSTVGARPHTNSCWMAGRKFGRFIRPTAIAICLG